MLHKSILLAVFLVLPFFCSFAIKHDQESFELNYSNQNTLQDHSHINFVDSKNDFYSLSLGWAVEHSNGYGIKFHHPEDGSLHGFCFERLNRKNWFRRFSCMVLKCMLILIHLALILVAFLHTLH